MIHIVFQHADVGLLKKAIDLDIEMKGEIFEIKDEWGVGPLKGLDTEEGWMARLDWWKDILQGYPHIEKSIGSFDDRETVDSIKLILENESGQDAWIWIGQNQHDVTGYYWLMPQLRAYQGRVMIIFLNNLPFINEKGLLFYPLSIHDILPKEAVKAKKLARAITLSEYEVDPDEWKKISEENSVVRILEGGKKIIGKDERFYDDEIIKNLSADWQKAIRVLANTLHRMKIKTGDAFLMWRIRQLISEGQIEILGDTSKGWKEIDLRLPQTQAVSIIDEIQAENNEAPL